MNGPISAMTANSPTRMPPATASRCRDSARSRLSRRGGRPASAAVPIPATPASLDAELAMTCGDSMRSGCSLHWAGTVTTSHSWWNGSNLQWLSYSVPGPDRSAAPLSGR
ncbi:MAG: hypothetical protein AVDCRST_MAG33-2131 [uncultured Thermomicrobiales bacterium]|uniref:Uncharacterized protein n=1 Tax=uncultured Thermomicrobiales bacterium TaxID=1645740 RepID=A0A6J4V1I5_9BACT|nr:MAG: hypothetical protein AVDCRST_MAG33-2131 [uncultured Thermomicrobiales bacterium]